MMFTFVMWNALTYSMNVVGLMTILRLLLETKRNINYFVKESRDTLPTIRNELDMREILLLDLLHCIE